jgi:hypothetical protein
MTDALLQEKPDLEETWMRGALLGRLGASQNMTLVPYSCGKRVDANVVLAPFLGNRSTHLVHGERPQAAL